MAPGRRKASVKVHKKKQPPKKKKVTFKLVRTDSDDDPSYRASDDDADVSSVGSSVFDLDLDCEENVGSVTTSGVVTDECKAASMVLEEQESARIFAQLDNEDLEDKDNSAGSNYIPSSGSDRDDSDDETDPVLMPMSANTASTGRFIYRHHVVGRCFKKALYAAVKNGILPNFRVRPILEVFDCIMDRLLRRPTHLRMAFKAKDLVSYQFSDGVWKFVLKDVAFRSRKCIGTSEYATILCSASDVFDHFHDRSMHLDEEGEEELPELAEAPRPQRTEKLRRSNRRGTRKQK